MAKSSKISWTNDTWNPVTGCSAISEGCKNCYAAPMARRLAAMGAKKYRCVFDVTCHPEMLKWSELNRKEPRLIFVNSMSDLFHPDVPDEFIVSVFGAMAEHPQHRFQVLTKRPERLATLDAGLPGNMWLGVTVESAKYVSRIDFIRDAPVPVRFISIEPMLSAVPDLDLSGIAWVIVGGEKCRNHRPMDESWVADVRDQCIAAKVKFFFKQWHKKDDNLLCGRTWLEIPPL